MVPLDKKVLMTIFWDFESCAHIMHYFLEKGKIIMPFGSIVDT